MIFELGPPQITKEVLLNANPEEAYFSHYLGINPTSGLFCSPLRVDNTPTCSFYRNKKDELIFKDFGNGFHGNFISVVMERFRVPYYKALKIIATDFGLTKEPGEIINPPKIVYDGTTVGEKANTIIQCQIKDFTKQDLDWWGTFGITKKTLDKFKVFNIETVFLNNEIFSFSNVYNPIYGYYFGKDEGRELWKIYFPMRKKFRFLLNNSKLQGAKQLPPTGDIVVVTKSLKDVMTLYELGIPAVAPQAESVVISSRQYGALKKRFERVIFNYDWDRTGQSSMIKCRKSFKSICLSFKDKDIYAKDISDYVAKVGKEKAKDLIKEILHELEFGEHDYQYYYFEGDK